MSKKCTYVDGVASTQAIDTAGEIVSIEGLDISSLIGGALNWEHKSDLPSQIVGKILEAKKIYSEKDCETERQKYFWKKCGLPFLYIIGRLFDDKKESSKEVAALFHDDAEHPDEPKMVGFSVEGAKINKTGAIITHSIARKVTITHIPANKQCIAEVLNLKQKEKDDIDSLFKGEIELFKFEPSYEEILEKKEKELEKHTIPTSQNETNEGLAKSVIAYVPGNHPEHPIKHQKGNLVADEKGKPFPAVYRGSGLHSNDPGHALKFKSVAEGQKHLHEEFKAGRLKTHPWNHRFQYVGKSEKLEKALVDKGKSPKEKKIIREQRERPDEGIAGVHMQAHGQPAGVSAKGAALRGTFPTHPGESKIEAAKDFHRIASAANKTPSPNLPKSEDMNKALEAGSAMAAPGQLVQGSALTRESLEGLKERTKKVHSMNKKERSEWYKKADDAYKGWSDRENFKSYMQKRLPHLAEGEVDAIGRILALKKCMQKDEKLSKMYPSSSQKKMEKTTDIMMASESDKKSK